MNEAHDPALRSWVESANDPACDFPVQNLPFGIFRKKGSKERPRGGVAIGDQILDLAGAGLNTGPTLNVLAAAGRPDQRNGNLDIQLETHLRTRQMPRPHCLTRSNFRHAYWTPAQIVTHQASNGCNLRPGDLLGSGTISGPSPDSLGSMLELTQGGENPLALPTGETRAFIEDGDEVILRGRCAREGFASIGFGEAASTVRG